MSGEKALYHTFHSFQRNQFLIKELKQSERKPQVKRRLKNEFILI